MGDGLAEKVAAMEKRLQVLEDERSILALLNAYGHSLDYGLKEAFVDLFTENACYLVLFRGVPATDLGGVIQPPEGIRGRDLITQYAHGHTSAPAAWHKHFMVEPIIRWQSDDEVLAESYFTRLDEDENGPYLLAFGRYRDRMVRCPDEKWRFKERICEVENRPLDRQR